MLFTNGIPFIREGTPLLFKQKAAKSKKDWNLNY